MRRIYFDYAASTPMDQRVFAEMQPYFCRKFGNPGSLHLRRRAGLFGGRVDCLDFAI
jgi:cysteine desulfurase